MYLLVCILFGFTFLGKRSATLDIYFFAHHFLSHKHLLTNLEMMKNWYEVCGTTSSHFTKLRLAKKHDIYKKEVNQWYWSLGVCYEKFWTCWYGILPYRKTKKNIISFTEGSNFVGQFTSHEKQRRLWQAFLKICFEWLSTYTKINKNWMWFSGKNLKSSFNYFNWEGFV